MQAPVPRSWRFCLPATVLAVLVALPAALTHAVISEDFNDLIDNPPFTRIDLVATIEGGGPYVTWSYPDLGSGNYAYRILADASTSAGVLGRSNGSSNSNMAEVYSDFIAHVDYVDWATSPNPVSYGLYLGKDHGFASSDGYTFSHDPAAGVVSFGRVDDAVEVQLDSQSITLSQANDYRMVLARSGSSVVARLYQLPDLSTPIADLSGTAATGWTGLSPVIFAASYNHLHIADATFDNFRSADDIEDLDGDGLGDVDEAVTHGSSPYVQDTDGDGLDDDEEVNVLLTDPALSDTDSDGAGDGDEVAAGTDPLDPDTDGDLVCDGGGLVSPCTTPGPDNCPFVTNFNQNNSDSFAAGDECQCGDVDGDHAVTALDLAIARENLVGAPLSGSFDATHCDYLGDAGCGVEDLFVLDRILQGLSVEYLDACVAYGGP